MEEDRRCINCSLKLRWLRWQNLRNVEENIFNIISRWVYPTPISQDDIICMECLETVQSVRHLEPAPEPLFGHTSVCFACGSSILRTRTSRVPFYCEERNVIIGWIYPHLVHHLERVCRACWMAAKINVQRQQQQDAHRLLHVGDDQQPEPVNIPEPPPIPQEAFFQPQRRQDEPKINSNKYKRVAGSPRCCVFPDCQNIERLLISRSLKLEVLGRFRIYIPPRKYRSIVYAL